jgi:hypothetical protein
LTFIVGAVILDTFRPRACVPARVPSSSRRILMQFFEGIIRALDGCTGFLEVFTILIDAAAIYLGIRTYQKQQHTQEKLAHHHAKAPLKKPSWMPALILGVIAILFTALTAFKYLAMGRP